MAKNTPSGCMSLSFFLHLFLLLFCLLDSLLSQLGLRLHCVFFHLVTSFCEKVCFLLELHWTDPFKVGLFVLFFVFCFVFVLFCFVLFCFVLFCFVFLFCFVCFCFVFNQLGQWRVQNGTHVACCMLHHLGWKLEGWWAWIRHKSDPPLQHGRLTVAISKK